MAFAVEVRRTSFAAAGWRTLLGSSRRRSLTFSGALGATYQFRVRAVDALGRSGAWASASSIVPTGSSVPCGHYLASWRGSRGRNVWQGHVIAASTSGAGFTLRYRLRYRGGTLSITGDRGPPGGSARVPLDRRRRTISLRSGGAGGRCSTASRLAPVATG